MAGFTVSPGGNTEALFSFFYFLSFLFLLSISRSVRKVSLRLLREELGRQPVHPQRPALIGGQDRAGRRNIVGVTRVDYRGFEVTFSQ